jgi:AcrR family transcriptional regulator
MPQSKKITELRQRRPEEVRARILEAALQTFAANGFEGAIMQKIAQQADISLSLMVYHFKSKKNLWREAVSYEAERFYMRVAAVNDETALTATDRLRRLFKSLVELCAERPQLNRIITLEGYQKSERLTWLSSIFGKSGLDTVLGIIAAAQAEGSIRPNLSPERLRYAVLGVACLPSIGAEFRELTGLDASSPKEVAASIEFINNLVFINVEPKPAKRKK